MSKIFSTTLIKKEFKLQSGFFFVGLVYYFLLLPYYTIQEIISDDITLAQEGFLPYYRGFRYEINEVLGSIIPLMIIFAIGLGLSFAREKQKKTMEEMARMPFSRMQIYFSKVIVSLFVMAVPLIFNVMLFLFIGSSTSGFDIFVDKNIYIHSTIKSIAIGYYVYFFYVMASMLFGSVAGAFLCGSIFISFPITLVAMIVANIDITFSTEISKWKDLIINSGFFTPGMYVATGLTYGVGMIMVVVLTVLYCIMGYYLFTIYKMERNSEFLTYVKTEKIFKIGVFLCSVLAGRMLFDSILASVASPMINQTIGVVIGAVLGYIIPKKIIDKSKVA